MDLTELRCNDVTNVKSDDGAGRCHASRTRARVSSAYLPAGAMPFPCCERVQQDFTLCRFDALGCPSQSPEKGLWACERHRPQLSGPAPRIARIGPTEALIDLEILISTETALLEDWVADQEGDPGALKTLREEITRGLAALKKAVAS